MIRSSGAVAVFATAPAAAPATICSTISSSFDFCAAVEGAPEGIAALEG